MDLYEEGQRAYYFEEEDAGRGLVRYFRKGSFMHNSVRVPDQHNAGPSADFDKSIILEHPEMVFNIMTNSSRFIGFRPENVVWL
jgi:hypothetical protein